MNYSMADGSTYDGHVRTKIVNLKKIYIKHGQGKQSFNENTHYDGMWKNGRYHGFGTLVLESGDKYSGEFQNGCYHGDGSLTYAQGGNY